MDIHALLRDLLDGQTLTSERSEALFEALLSGDLDDAQIASALSLIQVRGATPDELVGAAQVMRRRVTPVPVTDSGSGVL